MNIEQEETYFKVFDDNGYLLAYFQPDYGSIHPKEKEEEIIEEMIKSKAKISAGLLYLPMLKFNIADKEYSIEEIKRLLEHAVAKIEAWMKYLSEIDEIKYARVIRSHTDPDMLALLLDLRFDREISINSDEMNGKLFNILREFIDKNLL